MSAKINLVIRLQHWMDSVPGQTFLNYAYSWGASIVILGALFKLTHLPGGNFMLFIGMGTEVVVFFLSAFDRPFDKNEIGKELPHDYETDEEIAARLGLTDDEEEKTAEDAAQAAPAQTAAAQGVVFQGPAVQGAPVQGAAAQPAAQQTPGQGAAPQGSGVQSGAAQGAPVQNGGGTVIIGFPGGQSVSGGAHTASATAQPAPQAATDATSQTLSAAEAARAAIAATAAEGAEPFENEAKRLAEIIRLANDELLRRAQAALSPEMEEATQTYIEKLRILSETFQKVDEQSGRLARDSEEMAELNRTLTAINKTYDLHFKSISQQVGTIEKINEQTRSLARRIEELNQVYGRMIQALSVNIQQGAAPQKPLSGE